MLNGSSFHIQKTTWLVLFLLISVALVMHSSALDNFWRFDDGWLLGFASCYAPWEYFFVLAVTREISYAFVTPWHPLIYDINLALFGLNPVGHYAHQLSALILAAYMSFLLLRLWIGLGWAIFGAVLFLIGTPTVHVAHELMTGHYLEGLIFACMAIYGFVRAMRSNNQYWLLFGILGYGLACTCKEIYIPLPIFLIALPEGDWKKRIRFIAPFLAVTVGYLYWRFAVIGTVIGGYHHHESSVEFPLKAFFLAYIKLPMVFFLHNFIGYLALFALAVLLIVKTNRRNWLILLCSIAVISLPLVPIIILPGIFKPDRYLFVAWWAVALGISVLCSKKDGYLNSSFFSIFIAVIIGIAALQTSQSELKALRDDAKPFESLYRLPFNHKAEDMILPPLGISGWYAQFLYNGLISAVSSCGVSKPHPKLLSSVEAITAIDPGKTPIYRYDVDCNCMKEVSSTIPALLSAFAANRQNRELLIRYLPLPYRPRRDQPRVTFPYADGGVIENINVVGNAIEINGWARLRDDEPSQQIAIFVPVLPVGQSLTSIERMDVVEYFDNMHYLGAGFRATLQFSDSADATYVAAHFCAQKLAGGSFAPIKNPFNQDCSVFFQSYP
ncbi:MAG: hypothetical protein LM550_04805 [Candidatus Contendobacter sp.]|jgi:hypothetical protein|nr:hypothetical protein [Gammaproteobacteria bacterium]MCC8993004.1 hypothetical protein [Candidatus Contendobacter sp.]